MHQIKLDEKGQFTIPKLIRDRYHLSKGNQLKIIDLGNGILEVILLKHSSELPPPVVTSGKNVSNKKMKKAASKIAIERFNRSKKI